MVPVSCYLDLENNDTVGLSNFVHCFFLFVVTQKVLNEVVSEDLRIILCICAKVYISPKMDGIGFEQKNKKHQETPASFRLAHHRHHMVLGTLQSMVRCQGTWPVPRAT